MNSGSIAVGMIFNDNIMILPSVYFYFACFAFLISSTYTVEFEVILQFIDEFYVALGENYDH